MVTQTTFANGCTLEIGVEIIDKALAIIECFFNYIDIPVPEIHYDNIKVTGPYVSIPTSLTKFQYDDSTGQITVEESEFMKENFLHNKSTDSAIKDFCLEKNGLLLNPIFHYHSLNFTPVPNYAFRFIIDHLDHDAGKYESIVDRNRKNSSKGGSPHKNSNNPP